MKEISWLSLPTFVIPGHLLTHSPHQAAHTGSEGGWSAGPTSFTSLALLHPPAPPPPPSLPSLHPGRSQLSVRSFLWKKAPGYLLTYS